MLIVDRIVQFSPLCRDNNRTMDAVHAFLGAFPSDRSPADVGVNMTIYPLGDATFLELIEPFDPQSGGMRRLERFGEGWFMLNADLQEAPVDEIREALRQAGVRLVRARTGADGSGSWHIHPADAAGVLLALYLRPDRHAELPDYWAGPHWRNFEKTNQRVVNSILGASLATPNLEETARLYTALGFRFGETWEDEGDLVRQANCPGGTFLQLRTPSRDGAPSAAWLAQRGIGLFHLVFGANDLARVHAALQRVSGKVTREARYDGAQSLWATADQVFGMPLEFRTTDG